MTERLDYKTLCEAARYNDALAEEHGLERAVEQSGIDMTAAIAVAKQRALRMVLIVTGEQEKLGRMAALTTPTPLSLTDEQKKLLATFEPVYLDGLVTGARAMRGEA